MSEQNLQPGENAGTGKSVDTQQTNTVQEEDGHPSSQEVAEHEAPGKRASDVQGMETSGETHHMSIALTIGATIGVIGLILVLYGLWGKADYSRSDNININIWWGLVMLIFGIIMSVGGYLAAHRRAVPTP